MYEFGIRNDKTWEIAEVIAKNFKSACENRGWNVKDCHCVWRSTI